MDPKPTPTSWNGEEDSMNEKGWEESEGAGSTDSKIERAEPSRGAFSEDMRMKREGGGWDGNSSHVKRE